MRVKLSLKIYPKEAVLNACYSFIDRAYIFLDLDKNEDYIRVTFKGKRRYSSKYMKSLLDEFKNELLYSSLRFKISKNNKKIREFIIGRALYSALPSEDSDEAGDLNYQQDPLGIAIPWEEKYDKKKKNSLSKVQ